MKRRAAAVLLLTLRGTPTIYFGDEIGIGNVEIPASEVPDPQALRDPGTPTRDAYRTPMQWTASPRAGFSDAAPWLPLTPDHERRNVKVQRDEPGSMLRLYRRLIRLREREPVLVRGRYESVPGQGPVLAFFREHDGVCRFVAVNFSDEPTVFRLPFELTGARLLSSRRNLLKMICTDRTPGYSRAFSAPSTLFQF